MKSNINDHQLALFGGDKEVKCTFEKYNPHSQEEIDAATEVAKTGVLSNYLAGWSENFYGGKKVKEFERDCRDFFKVKHAITFNSWTSGLVAAVGAIGIEPGDEIIVTPWTMAATATAILHWNAIPVFADIEEDMFCLDPKSVEKNITKYTKAILSVDIFGQSANMSKLKEIAANNNLKIISDTAQAPAALYKGSYAGTIADIGGFSLNCHKHIHTGEGGIAVTNNDDLAERLCLIRNHAEVVASEMGRVDISNLIGHNFRLGEIECAIGIEQLKKLKELVRVRQELAEQLNDGLKGLKGLITPVVRNNCTHVYYAYPLRLDFGIINSNRETIIKALRAEGVPGLGSGYINLHLLPMYQKKIAYGNSGFPWNSDICKRNINYQKGICPIAEKLQDSDYMCIEICAYDFNEKNISMIINAFHKVWGNIEQLRL